MHAYRRDTKVWLQKANDDPNTDSFSVVGKILEEYMEVPPDNSTWDTEVDWLSPVDSWEEKKESFEELLEKHGLKYLSGGRIVRMSAGLKDTALVDTIKKGELESVEVEFQRAIESADKDPAIAITAGCSLLEALFKGCLEKQGIPLPKKQTLKPLWALVQKDLGLDPQSQTDDDVRRILGGFSSVVDGVGALRTHGGSAHGGGELRYRVKARHARLAVNSAHTLALFVIETWQEKEQGADT